jgi:hypothetical protein
MVTRSRTRPIRTAPLTVATFDCVSCGTTHHSADAILPIGWTARAGSTWCLDCTRAGIPVRVLREPRVAA